MLRGLSGVNSARDITRVCLPRNHFSGPELIFVSPKLFVLLQIPYKLARSPASLPGLDRLPSNQSLLMEVNLLARLSFDGQVTSDDVRLREELGEVMNQEVESTR